MQHLKVSGAVRPIKWSLGVKWLKWLSLFLIPLPNRLFSGLIQLSFQGRHKSDLKWLRSVRTDTACDGRHTCI